MFLGIVLAASLKMLFAINNVDTGKTAVTEVYAILIKFIYLINYIRLKRWQYIESVIHYLGFTKINVSKNNEN